MSYKGFPVSSISSNKYFPITIVLFFALCTTFLYETRGKHSFIFTRILWIDKKLKKVKINSLKTVLLKKCNHLCYLFDQSFCADDVEPRALFHQVDGDRILEVLLSDVFPDGAGHAPDVLEPVAHILVRHRVTGKTGQSAGDLIENFRKSLNII